MKVNYLGNLEGDYLITDNLPEGLEPIYLRIKWRGDKAPHLPALERIDTDKNPEYIPFVDGWTHGLVEYATDNNSTVRRSHYYISLDKRQIRALAVDFAAGGEQDKYAGDYQILCKVTDERAILDLDSEVSFLNEATLSNTTREIGKDTDQQTITFEKSLMKNSTRVETDGSKFPFEIVVNSRGEDLFKGADTYTVIDQMGSSLVFDASTLKVQTVYGEDVEYSAQFDRENNKIILTVPDNVALRITYSTRVNAPPGTPVDISNKVMWEVYEQEPGDNYSRP